ncbi:DUF3310 domain-containing protein [candidate division KSB1 bacterium]
MTRQFEIYYHNLNTEAKADLLAEFDTKPDAENWEAIPLTVIEREDFEPDNGHTNGKEPIDRVEEWRKFSKHMEKYIQERTVQKYGMDDGVDLMTMTDIETCLWNILKYAIRLHTGSNKEHDLEKVAHYACFAWSKLNTDNGNSKMKLVKNGNNGGK